MTERRFGELFLERGEAAEGGIHRLAEFALRFAAAVFLHHLPEQGMIVMSAAVVADGGIFLFQKELGIFQPDVFKIGEIWRQAFPCHLLPGLV